MPPIERVIFPSQVNLKIRDLLGVHGQSDIFPGKLNGELQAVVDVTKFLNPELGSFPQVISNFSAAAKDGSISITVPDNVYWLVTHVGGRTTSTDVVLGEEMILTCNPDPTDFFKRIQMSREIAETTLTNINLGYTMEKGIIMQPGSSFSILTPSGFTNAVLAKIYAEVIAFSK